MITVTLHNDHFGTFVCPNDFVGWNSFEQSLIRSEKWKGVFDGFGLSLTFFGGAYKFLLDCYNREGADVVVRVTITEEDFLGETLTYEGLLNFAEDATFERLSTSQEAQSAYDGKFISLQVVPAPNDLKTLLESRSRVKVSVPIAIEEIYKSAPPTYFFWHPNNPQPADLDGNAITDLRLYRPDKIFVHSRMQYNIDVYLPPTQPYIVSQGASDMLAGDWFFNQELSAGSDARIATSNKTTLNHGNNAISVEPFFTAARSGTYRVRLRASGAFRWKNQGLTSNSRVVFRIGWGAVANSNFRNIYTTGNNIGIGNSVSEELSINFDEAFFLQENDNLFYYQRLEIILGTVNNILEFAFSELSIELSEIRYDLARLTDVFLAHEFAAALLNIIVGRETLQSAVLGRIDSYPTSYATDGNAGLLAITTGFLLRKQHQPIQTSFDEFFNSLNACYNVGLWVDADNDKIVIENARFFYNPNQIAATFEFVDDIKVTVAGDKLYNEISFRYSKFEDRGAALNQDPHGEVSFHAPLKFISNAYELDCQYVASGESVTIAKNADFERAKDDKTGYDTDKFFICLARSNRLKLPVLGVSSAGDELVIGLNDASYWYYERFFTVKPWFGIPPSGVFPTQFELFNAGVNNGIYAYNKVGGNASGDLLSISPPFPNPSAITPGVSYVEIIANDPTFPYIAQSTQNYDLIENYENPISGFNYDITPARSLLRHKFLWNVGMLKKPARLWRFGGGEGNVNFISRKVSAAIDSDEYLQNPLKQNQDILPFDELLAARFYPEYIEFEAPVRISLWKQIKANRHGVIRVSDRNSNYLEGYIVEAKRVRQGEKVIGKFKLLRAFDGQFGDNNLPPNS